MTEIRRDQVSCAVLQGGITFNLPDRAHDLTRWTVAIERLRRHSLAGAFTQADTLGDQVLQRPIIPSPNNGQ